MAKFENSVYYKIWNSAEGKLITSTILADPNLLHANHTFWREKFRVDSNIIPTPPKGKASFTQTMRQTETGGVMDMRAPLGDSVPAERGNLAFYTGVIPDFITKGFVETAMEREYREELFDQFDDRALIAAFANDFLQPALDSVNQTLSNMAAQIMSKGNIVWNYGDGAKTPILKADIPTENFLKAGAVVWSDTTNCKILDQIRKIYHDVQEHLGISMPMQLEVTRNCWNNYFLKNAQVLEQIRYQRSLGNVLMPQVFEANTEMAMEAIKNVDGLPTIVIVEEAQYDTASGTTIHGWSDSVAVLRPMGYAGLIRRTNILDEKIYKKYGTNLIERNFTQALGGVATIMNSVINNGNLKEWHSDCMMSAVPALDEFLYHFIIDTTQTSQNTF